LPSQTGPPTEPPQRLYVNGGRTPPFLLFEKVVGPHGRPVEREKAGTVHRVGAGLDDHVGHAAQRLAERRVESGGLDFELRHRIGGGHISRNDVGAALGGGRAAVNGDIALVAAGAAHGVIHNVRRLEGTVQPGIAHERHARRQSGHEERVAVDSGSVETRIESTRVPTDAVSVFMSGASADMVIFP